jgi:predicted enzyme related to lactoylglutathione lyase
MEQHTIVHFEIPADQPERAARFYRELFGWDIKQYEGTVAGGMDYWMVRTIPTDEQGRPSGPGVNGGLMRRMYPNQGPVNYINVESVDQSVARAQQLGAKVLMGKTPVPGMGWFAQLTDTEGNLFAVWESDVSAAMSGAAAGGEAGNAGR